MSGIAEVLINLDYEVTGSDRARSSVTERLESLGAKIYYCHSSKNVEDAHVIVTSTAINPDNPETISAKERMIPVIPRAEMLAELMRMKYGIAVAGTHGKTTTTSLIATILAEGQLDPTVVNGGRLKSLGSSAKLGQSEFLVAEADESDGSFLRLSPTLAVVTTLDEEHLDHYKTFDNMKSAFLEFMNRVPFYGATVICLDEPHLQSLIPKLDKRYITYGLNSQADYSARNISVFGVGINFDVVFRGKNLGTIASAIPGLHNVRNTLAAVAVGMELELDFDIVKAALKNFSGVQRRFEIVIDTDSFVLLDDYGHHPAEIKATLRTAKEVWPERRLLVVFQPHRYSRTRLLMESFWSSFNDADYLIVVPIYPAGEEPIEGASAKEIARGVRYCGHKHVEYLDDINEVVAVVLKAVRFGDIMMTLGAGNIGELCPRLADCLPDSLNHQGKEY